MTLTDFKQLHAFYHASKLQRQHSFNNRTGRRWAKARAKGVSLSQTNWPYKPVTSLNKINKYLK